MNSEQLTINNEKRAENNDNMQGTNYWPLLIYAICFSLFVLAACANTDLPFLAKLGISVTVDGNPIGDNGNVFFNVGGGVKEFTAIASGAEAESYNWSLVRGQGVVSLDWEMDTAEIGPLNKGDARIRVDASGGEEISARTEFNIYVNEAGISNWTFKMLDGSAEIFNEDNLEIPTGTVKTINLAAVTEVSGDTVAFSLVIDSNNGGVTINPSGGVISNNSFTIQAINDGQAKLSITAEKGTEVITKTFTVIVGEPGVLLEWDSAWGGGTVPVAFLALNPSQSGYGWINSGFNDGTHDIWFGTRFTTRVVIENDGAIKIGQGVGGASALLIGVGDNSNPDNPLNTNSTVAHGPGQFDLSEGTFRLTVDYSVAATGSYGAFFFRIAINSNQSGPTVENVLNNTGNIQWTTPDFRTAMVARQGLVNKTVPGKIIVEFTPSVMCASVSETGRKSLETAYLGFITNDMSAQINITSIKLQRIE